jgi:hypothetical protein
MDNTIIFMGQLRNIDNFLIQIDILNSIKKLCRINEIIYITDDGELSVDNIKLLSVRDVTIHSKKPLDQKYIEHADAELKKRSAGQRTRSGGMTRGTIWRQLYDLKYGLNLINENNFVLRTRTDISISKEFYIEILTNPRFRRKLSNSPFYYSIWIQWFSLLNPFYIHDTCFYGQCADLSKLVSDNYNIEYSKYYPGRGLPAFFWLRPFAELKWVKCYFENYYQKRFNFIWIFKKEYIIILINYWKMIVENFHVEFGDISWYLQWNSSPVHRIWNYINIKNFNILFLLLNKNKTNACESVELVNSILHIKPKNLLTLRNYYHNLNFKCLEKDI